MSAGKFSTGAAGPHLGTRAVARRYGVCANTVLSWLKREPAFPRPFRGASGKFLWLVADLEAYDRARAGGGPPAEGEK
jgi:hypothetical protein